MAKQLDFKSSQIFNFLSFQNREKFKRQGVRVAMSRERIFEYTPIDLKEQFESLNEDAIAILKDLPTFLCSEIEQIENGFSLLIKFGRITHVKVHPKTKEVTIVFQTDRDFDGVPFKDVETANSILKADRSQLHRTRWAVREGSYQDVLDQLDEHTSDLVDTSVELNDSSAARVETQSPLCTKKIPNIAQKKFAMTETDTGVNMEQTDFFGNRFGVEQEVPAPDQENIVEPFDPEDIDVTTRSMTVGQLLSRASSGMIDLQPDFQRRWGIWDNKKQSRLIESLLLRIPLPVLYAAENEDERWEIVDGIQRLSTITRFVMPEILKSEKLILSDLEYLKDYVGKDFSGLTSRMQLRLQESELVTHVIRKGTPPEVKFNIFARINTGGVTLSPQELRHAITPGKARSVLENWSNLDSFLSATDRSVRSTRMDDRELILRFLAFYISGVEEYHQADMDGFLIAAMGLINGFDDSRVETLKREFSNVMETSEKIFEKDSFRKKYSNESARYPINKALFEVISVNLAKLTEDQRRFLVAKRNQVRYEFIELCRDTSFDTAISQGTGNVRRVRTRFEKMQSMLAEVLEHD